MKFDFSNGNLDSCTIQGNCAQEPCANFVNEYVINEICDIVYYIQNLKKLNFKNDLLEKEIISYIAEINLNYDYLTENLINVIQNIAQRKKEVEEFYSDTCKSQKKYIKRIKNENNLSKFTKISEIAKIGEKLFLNRQKFLNEEENTLYTIYLMLIKNLAKNLSEILNFGYNVPKMTNKFFEACNVIRPTNNSKNNYLRKIQELYETNYLITDKKYSAYVENFGNITQASLSFSSRKNKCILISGRELKDLDELLKAIKDENIDLYTHNGMMYAHQYKYFASNNQLVAQYQKNPESIKYDFVTFPGPIILGRGQQNKFEGVYRGNLYTTNKIAPFGVSFIENYNFEKVVDIAKNSAGFKKAQNKDSLQIGYNESEVNSFLYKLTKDIISGKYTSVLFIGLLHNKINNVEYYKRIIENLKENTFVISLVEELNLPNSKHFPSYYDYNLTLKLFKHLCALKKEHKFSIKVFITDCTSYISPNIIMLNYFDVKNIFIPICRKLPNTAYLEEILSKYFKTHITTYNLEQDLRILNSKEL